MNGATKDFLGKAAPVGYVPGLGRGAIGVIQNIHLRTYSVVYDALGYQSGTRSLGTPHQSRLGPGTHGRRSNNDDNGRTRKHE
jgi:hypothetical protein